MGKNSRKVRSRWIRRGLVFWAITAPAAIKIYPKAQGPCHARKLICSTASGARRDCCYDHSPLKWSSNHGREVNEMTLEVPTHQHATSGPLKWNAEVSLKLLPEVVSQRRSVWVSGTAKGAWRVRRTAVLARHLQGSPGGGAHFAAGLPRPIPVLFFAPGAATGRALRKGCLAAHFWQDSPWAAAMAVLTGVLVIWHRASVQLHCISQHTSRPLTSCPITGPLALRPALVPGICLDLQSPDPLITNIPQSGGVRVGSYSGGIPHRSRWPPRPLAMALASRTLLQMFPKPLPSMGRLAADIMAA
uniref:Uncharacterized protein n=1 Tax=Sphaerodactylus townsendi TaxID=933632 RepID=A0ACB8FGW9_9SAUR